MPCNFHLRRLAERVKEGVRAAGGTPMEFNTIAISDGITMGTEGMKTSLVSREVIADSIELVARGHMFDAVIALSGCDKTIPGCVMALARLDVPSLMLYGGSIAPGRFRGKDVTIQEVFEAVGAHAAGECRRRADELETSPRPAPAPAAASSPPTRWRWPSRCWASRRWAARWCPPRRARRARSPRTCGRLVIDVLERDLRPSEIITPESLENAIAAVAMTGGSTNAVLHLLAVANEAGVELTIDDFDRIAWRTPLLGDLKPGGATSRPTSTAPAACRSCPAPRRGRAAARRLDHGHRPDDRRRPTRGRGGRGPAGRPAAVRSARAERRLRDPARQPRARRLRREARRARPHGAPRPGARVRVRGGRLRRRRRPSRSSPATSS